MRPVTGMWCGVNAISRIKVEYFFAQDSARLIVSSFYMVENNNYVSLNCPLSSRRDAREMEST